MMDSQSARPALILLTADYFTMSRQKDEASISVGVNYSLPKKFWSK
jgi:hypothetical protein